MNTTADAKELLAIENGEMSEKDKKTRRHWLIATLVYFLGFPALLFLMFVILAGDRLATIALFGLILILSSIPFWIIYHCAYRKPGTKWLMFYLIILPIQFVSSLQSLREDPRAWLGIIIGLPICIWWYVLSLKLRKINKSQQPHKQDPQYLKAVHALKSAKTMEELEWQFSNLMKEWPQFEAFSSKEYSLRKREFDQPL